VKIISSSYWLEVPETLEEGSAKTICEKPYRIQRETTENGYTIWWGYNTNWKLENGKWSQLIDGKFVPCDEPEYEKLFKQLAK
jgi:roadblock/LC7 domain-containing protein